MKYRAKTIEIDAWQVGTEPVPHWIDVALANGDIDDDGGNLFLIYNTEHISADYLEAYKGEWIIKDFDGTLHPCADEVFHLKYERVEC